MPDRAGAPTIRAIARQFARQSRWMAEQWEHYPYALLGATAASLGVAVVGRWWVGRPTRSDRFTELAVALLDVDLPPPAFSVDPPTGRTTIRVGDRAWTLSAQAMWDLGDRFSSVDHDQASYLAEVFICCRPRLVRSATGPGGS